MSKSLLSRKNLEPGTAIASQTKGHRATGTEIARRGSQMATQGRHHAPAGSPPLSHTKPRLLDLFCGAGGCSVGYARAGFDVVGIDVEPQPNYPFEFHQANALAILRYSPLFVLGFDAIHASPPCQRHSAMSNCRPGLADEYPDLIAPVRDLLKQTGLPWVIENVPGAPLRADLTLCGQMFGLELYRHRLFEVSFPVIEPSHPRHAIPASRAGHWKPGTIMSVSGHVSPMKVAREAMGIDWTNREELAEAVPPAYTDYVGRHLLAYLAQQEQKVAA